MRFHQIVENAEPDYSDYSEAFDRYEKGFRIYKGLRKFTNDVEILKPIQRKSQNTTNYMTTLLSNLPEWSAYPKRNYCTVCTSSYVYAKNYGDLYYIFPENGSRIGVCPKNDIFNSFEIEMLFINGCIKSMDQNIRNIIMEQTGELLPRLDENNYFDIISVLKNYYSHYVQTDEYKNNLLEDLCDKTKTFDGFINFISPETNKFQLVNIANYDFNDSDDREVWTDGNCLAVTRDYIDEFVEKFM